MEMKDAVSSMRPAADGIKIPPGSTVTLAPDGGFHIMFVTLKRTLKEGDKLPVTLTFEKAGSVTTFLHCPRLGIRGADPHDPE